MKKNYISPKTKELNVEGIDLLTSSDPDVTLDPKETVNADGVESRRHNYNTWGEDEEY